jgi:hypothetical protein
MNVKRSTTIHRNISEKLIFTVKSVWYIIKVYPLRNLQKQELWVVHTCSVCAVRAAKTLLFFSFVSSRFLLRVVVHQSADVFDEHIVFNCSSFGRLFGVTSIASGALNIYPPWDKIIFLPFPLTKKKKIYIYIYINKFKVKQ